MDKYVFNNNGYYYDHGYCILEDNIDNNVHFHDDIANIFNHSTENVGNDGILDQDGNTDVGVTENLQLIDYNTLPETTEPTTIFKTPNYISSKSKSQAKTNTTAPQTNAFSSTNSVNSTITSTSASMKSIQSSESSFPKSTSSASSVCGKPPLKKKKPISSRTISKLNVFRNFRSCTKVHSSQENVSQVENETNDNDIASKGDRNLVKKTASSTITPPKWFEEYSKYFTPKAMDPNKNFEFLCELCNPHVTISANASSSGNLKRHLKAHHPAVNSEISKQNIDQSQPDLHDIIDHNILTQTQLDDKISEILIEGMIPNSLANLKSFKSLVSGLQSHRTAEQKLKVKSRNTITGNIEKMYNKFIENIKILFDKIQYFAATADVWKHQNKAYLGITIHWFDSDKITSNSDRKMAVLACTEIQESITYLVLAKQLNEVFTKYGIQNKVVSVTTDNGSNFVKAFRVFGEKVEKSPDIVPRKFDDDGIELESIEMFEVFPILENNPQSDNLEEDTILLPEHIRCAAHTLNLVTSDGTKSFDNTTFKKAFDSFFLKAKMLWNRQNSDPIHSSAIQKEIGVNLVTPNQTRWNSTFDSVGCLRKLPITIKKKKGRSMAIKDILNSLLAVIGIKNTKFETSDIDFMDEYYETMQPLAMALDVLQASRNKSEMGYLLPVLYSLKRNLQESKKKPMVYCSPLVSALLNSIDTRFSNTMKKENFIIAACIHPKFHFNWIKNDDEFKNLCISIFKSLKNECNCQVNAAEESSLPNVDDVDSKLFDFELFGKTCTKFSVPKSTNCIEMYVTKPEAEIQNYSKCLQRIFLRFSTPIPSSAAVERIFSIGGDVLPKKRNRLTNAHFEALLVLKHAMEFSIF